MLENWEPRSTLTTQIVYVLWILIWCLCMPYKMIARRKFSRE